MHQGDSDLNLAIWPFDLYSYKFIIELAEILEVVLGK